MSDIHVVNHGSNVRSGRHMAGFVILNTTGLTEPDDGDDGMEKKCENVAHVPDGIKLKKLKNSGRLRNSPTTRRSCASVADCPQHQFSARILSCCYHDLKNRAASEPRIINIRLGIIGNIRLGMARERLT